ncbi:hypothetical protein QAD02_004163 [Eretmocerus hayati]|uniref:Uncharacterized protein n=1 Tax=Eretmocerus hayati TaxID=131215 RepID=A0ACC2NP67_9HYME|nr:hypothetical protein QAD02_004163 [Eretmocerus hayati]
MKLMCTVEIANRLNHGGRRKAQQSCLTIGRQSVKDDQIYLLLQTVANKKGTKYKVNNNIEKVFSNFVHEGKATIRLIEPPQDLNIKSDAIQLKSFLHVLKLGLSKKLNPAVLTLSNLNPKNLSNALKKRIVIKQASDYPVLEGFPRTTEELHLSGLQRRSFDRQILKLQGLRILNLSENQLTNIPHELGMLPNLQELNLSDNLLGKGPINKWSWMSGVNISKSLCLLNLNSNQMTVIPDQINKLRSLITLHFHNNLITTLPQGIGSLSKLKYLVLSKNNLTHLPGNMRNLRLSDLDISDNPFSANLNDNNAISGNVGVRTLVESAAQVIVRKRVYYDASIIPFTLVQYLDKPSYCMCGAPCFSCYVNRFMSINLSTIAQSIKFSGMAGNRILFDCYFCSTRCLKLFSKNLI